VTIVRTLADFPADDLIEKDATIRGEHDEYRYDLTRIWDRSLPICVFIMLNPSTAASKPAVLRPLAYEVAVGPLYDDYFEAAIDTAECVICAWGSQKFAEPRAAMITEMLWRVCLLATPQCLRIARGGAPWHPLYVPYSADPIPFLDVMPLLEG
jgi:hypothetical protein